MHSKTIGAFEAKTHLSQLLDRVENGETIEITRRGHPIARLVPCHPTNDRERIQKLIARVKEERGSCGITSKDIAAWKENGRRS